MLADSGVIRWWHSKCRCWKCCPALQCIAGTVCPIGQNENLLFGYLWLFRRGDAHAVAQTNKVSLKVQPTVTTWYHLEPDHFWPQLPLPTSYLNPVHCHSKKWTLCIVCCPSVSSNRNLPWCRLYSTLEISSEESNVVQLTFMSFFRSFSHFTHLLCGWIFTSWLVGRSKLVAHGLIAAHAVDLLQQNRESVQKMHYNKSCDDSGDCNSCKQVPIFENITKGLHNG